MEFWKIVRILLEEVPEDWQDNFIAYKDLKKQLKLIYPTSHNDDLPAVEIRPFKRPRLSGDDDDDDDADHKDEMKKEFLKLVLMEVRKINWFFEYKEDHFVIKLQLMKVEINEARESKEELLKLGKRMIDFHGEMVLLKNFSALNYIGMLKILKKYDKRTGNLVRMSFIEKLLQEPFVGTEVISRLIAQCEMLICDIYSRYKRLASPDFTSCPGEGRGEHAQKLIEVLVEFANMENEFVKLCRSALRTMKKIRSGSRTVNEFSLPPMEFSVYGDLDESFM